MSYEYDAAYQLGRQAAAQLARDVEWRRQADERSSKPAAVVGELPTKVPTWVWFRKPSRQWDRFRPASAL